MDIFFVISGYLMAKLYDKGTILDFYRKRLDRLLPAYCFTILATLIIGCFLLVPVDFDQLFSQSLASVFFVPNVQFWSQNSYFDKSAFKPLLNLWSLGVELQFYLIVPFLYPLLRTRRAATILLITATFCACIFILTISPKTSFFMAPLRIWEFLFGALVAWFGERRPRDANDISGYQYSAILSLIAIILFAPLAPSSLSPIWGHPGVVSLIVCALTATIIYLGMPTRLESSVTGRSIAKIGDYSYSIYLVHFPLIVFWNYTPFDGTNLKSNGPLDIIILISLIGILSYLSYSLIEQRTSKYLHTKWARAGLPILVVAMAFLTLNVQSLQYNVSEKNIFSAWNDRDIYRCGKIFRILNPRENVCPINKIYSENNVLLVGNSHADSLKAEFAKVAEQNDLGAFFYVPNDPLLGGKIDAKTVVADAKRFDAKIIVLHYSKLYGKAPLMKEIRLLTELVKTNEISLVLIAPVPTYSVNVPQAMYEMEQQQSKVSNLSNNIQAHVKSIADFQSFISTLGNNEIMLVDPASILCPLNSNCLFADEMKHPYYFDEAHLTLTGSAFLRPLLQQVMEESPAIK